MRVEQVSIPVKDQDKALQFYTKKLGFTLVKDVNFGESQRWIELATPKGETKVVLYTPEGQENRIGTFSNIMFSTEDVEALFIELQKKEVEFEKEVTEECWGKHFIFKDVDGNSFCVSE